MLVDCQSVWKIFGARSSAAVKAVSERGLSKTQVLNEFNCVVGVSGASLQVRRGEIFCIMGLSGSGKSTLIRLLNRLIEPSLRQDHGEGQGHRHPQCRRTPRYAGAKYRHGIPERALLPHRTVLENAAFGLEVHGIPKAERNKIAGPHWTRSASATGPRYPAELSGGMQQRVGLARALRPILKSS